MKLVEAQRPLTLHPPRQDQIQEPTSNICHVVGFDFSGSAKEASASQAPHYAHRTKRRSTKNVLQVADPPGYMTQAARKLGKAQQGQVPTVSAEDREILQVKKAWEIAIAPLKSLPMSAIMTWFSGSSIQIFSVMMTGSLFWTPLKILFSSPFAVFAPFDTAATHDRLWMPKAVFLLGQILSIVLGMVKLQYMGLLPTTTSDWLAWETYEPDPIRFIIRQD